MQIFTLISTTKSTCSKTTVTWDSLFTYFEWHRQTFTDKKKFQAMAAAVNKARVVKKFFISKDRTIGRGPPLDYGIR